MAISYVTSNKVRHVCDGSTTVFNFSYKLLASSHLKVYPITRSTNTVGTLWVEGVNYSVTISTTTEGGSITVLTGAPANTLDLLLINDLPDDSELDLATVSTFPSRVLDGAFDRLHLLIVKLHEKTKRAIKLPINTTLAEFDLPAPSAGKALKWNDAATALVNSDTNVDEIVEEAEDARDAAIVAQGLAEDARDAAQTAEANAETAEANAETAESAAETAQAQAEAARDAAQAAVNSVGWRDVVFITNANSPYTLDETHRAKMICADCTAGAITINLPEIAGLDLTSAFMVGIKKTDASGNVVTVARASTDTIDGATSKTLGVNDAGAVFIPDTDPSPDEWTTAEFGAQAGNLSVDLFSGTGAQTAYTLSIDPGSENNTWVFVEGVYQQKDTYSVSGTTLTFSEAPPLGTNNLQVVIGSTLPLGVTGDGTVTKAKFAGGKPKATVTAVKTGAYSATSDDDLIPCNATGGAFTVTLPAAASNGGMEIEIIKTDSSANAITIDGNASETINGALTTTLNTQYEKLRIMCDGSNWLIMDRRTAFAATEAWADDWANATTEVQVLRVKNRIFIEGKASITGAGATNFTATIPAKYAPSAFYTFAGSGIIDVGGGNTSDVSASSNFPAVVGMISATQLRILTTNTGAYAGITATAPFTWANGDFITFNASWIVSGWNE
jgi:hypothetical protein